MISASELSDVQKQALADWAAEGASIADLQRRLKEEFDIGVTYMEARMLVLDLGLVIREAPKEEPGPETVPAESPEPEPEAAPGGVRVTMDDLALPGAVVSGKVTFSDGQTAVWMLDQFGRPGLDPDTAGYRPSQEDVAEFQQQLAELLRKRGY